MKPHERDILLERVDREGATVGVTIPDTLAIDDTVVPLRNLVVEYQRKTHLTEQEETELHDLIISLRRARKRRRDRIEHDETLDRESAESLVEEIIGIDRALAGLAAIGDENDIEAQIQQQQVADTQRWHHFLTNARMSDLDRSRKR